MNILGIETSCDDTAAAVITGGTLASHTRFSQLDLLKEYGGVVPELSARDHLSKLPSVVESACKLANIELSGLDAIAVTQGPGLVPALKTGISIAQGLALGLHIPLIGINHLEGHLLSVLLGEQDIEFPWLCLLVSGGHTQLIEVRGLGAYTLLGQSIDDAAGECFDKTARMLNLPFPGGPEIEKLAAQGDDSAYKLPVPLLTRQSLDFSFSGLKTAVMYQLRDQAKELGVWDDASQKPETRWPASVKANMSASFQKVMVKVLATKVSRALEQTGLKRVSLVGGVAANRSIVKALSEVCDRQQAHFLTTPLEFCADNAAMIALAGYLRLINSGKHPELSPLQATPVWPLAELKTPNWTPA